ncbi:unnamed protein product [Brassica rapa]|uniref:Uncharacterized protein n=2 Tax=Brassica TaxID=3705 RepID=A0A3P5ZFS4_BRACM|nr:unnamed protein product [Brassica napus]CAG7879940.1 unnamed protein product [Brassica rapa]VDC79376.1 unnamed protein product [Brassica rapa]
MVETRRNSSASKSFPASSSSPELSSHLHSLPSDLRSRSMLLLNLYVRSEFRCGPSHVRVSDSSKESATVMGKKQALISLSDKKDLATFGKGLQELGYMVQTAATAALGVRNRVKYRLALVPLYQSPFFLCATLHLPVKSTT